MSTSWHDNNIDKSLLADVDKVLSEATGSKEVKTLAALNKYINKKYHPYIKLVRGNGYYYFISKDDAPDADDLYYSISQSENSSVYINNIKGTTEDWWDGVVQQLMRDINNYGTPDKYTKKWK